MGLCLKLVFAVANPTLKRDAFEYSSLDEDGNATYKSFFKLPLHRCNEVFSQPSLRRYLWELVLLLAVRSLSLLTLNWSLYC